MLSCALCFETFKTRGSLNSHLTSHTNEKPYNSPSCPATFPHLANLKKHTPDRHKCVKIRGSAQDKNFNCSLCTYKSKEIANFKRHLRIHSAERPISCKIPGCDFKTKHNSCLSGHVRRVHNYERRYECTVEECNYRASNKSNLNVHLKIHMEETPFVCHYPGCNYACKQKTNLSRHTSTIHQNEKPFQCSVCEFRTKHRPSLRQHEDRHHNSKNFRCQFPKCDFATNNKQSLKHHFACRHTKKDLICEAPGCKYRCGTAALLKRHARKHMLPILKCPGGDSCNFSARLPGNLRLHLSHQHKHLQSAPLLLVPGQSDLKNTGQAGTEETPRPLKCPRPKCGYQTEFQHRYDRHMKHHNEESRTFACTFCSWRFTSYGQLERHVQAHVREKPNRCPYCKYTTVYSIELRKHATKVHDISVIPCRQENTYVKTCLTCNLTCSSYSEFVLHSMSHLRAVVVLKRLNLYCV